MEKATTIKFTLYLSKKEYPATHSMSTSWYGIDKDGKVAIIDFNENGPVPAWIGETSGEDIVECVFPKLTGHNFYELPLSDAQVELVKQRLHPVVNEKDVEFTKLVKINTAFTNEFVSKITSAKGRRAYDISLVCLSREHGLYICDFSHVNKNMLRSFLSKEIIQLCCDFHWDIEETHGNDIDAWTHDADNGAPILPMYYYYQPYSPHQLIDRVYQSTDAITEDQLSPSARARALRFPFSFKEQKSFQILEYYHASISIENAPNDDYQRVQVPMSDGSEALVQLAFLPELKCSDCDMCKRYKESYSSGAYYLWGFYTEQPTGMLISGFDSIDDWINIIGDSIYKCFTMDICSYITGGRDMYFLDNPERVRLIQGERGLKWFSNLTSVMVNAVNTFKPYCILVDSVVYPVIAKVFAIKDGIVTIGNTRLPVFDLRDASEHMAKIKVLLEQPYRGPVFDRIKPLNDTK